MQSDLRRWRRMFLASEHRRRRQALRWRRKELALTREKSYLHETVDLLCVELRRKTDAMGRMQRTLIEHQLPVETAMGSLRLCPAADDDEACPLAMEAINRCPPPFEGCCSELNPLWPTHRCAELGCGHRFNGVWLMFHFVRNRTFRCPMCRRGRERFRFDPSAVPECMARALAANGMPIA
jgi:hypothetical protein